MNTSLAKLQAILFTAGQPVSKNRLKKLIECDSEKLESLIEELNSTSKDGGVVLIDDGVNIALATNPDLEKFVEKLKKENQTSPLSNASQETLAIIAYAGPIEKIDLDFLRGVNTQFTLRRLEMRGLIQRIKEKDSQKFTITIEFLKHLGLKNIEEMKDYEKIKKAIEEGLEALKSKIEEEKI